MDEKMELTDIFSAVLRARGIIEEAFHFEGHYSFICYGPDGNELWRDENGNTICTLGKNFALDTILSGSSYSVTGPYMGMISSTSFSAISASDMMSSHSGWLEAGNAHAPTYTAPRPTMVFSSASGATKATSSAATFDFTGDGTVEGGFVVYGSGAVGTIDDTNGVLLSAGLLAGGTRLVKNGDSLAITWSLSC